MEIQEKGDTVLSYNGVQFGAWTETTGCSITFEPDEAGRTIKYHRYVMSFRTYVSGPQSVGLMKTWRAALGKNGGTFIYTGRGTGDIRVNTNGIRDVANGPFPRELSFKPLGGTAAELNWSIEFCVPECPDARYLGRPMEFTFSISYSHDEFGYSTRTITGRLKIPQNRTEPGSHYPQDSADDYWERCLPKLLPEFRRKYSRELSEDRSELRWTVVDEELEGPAPPPGIVKHEASLSFDSQGSAGLKWDGTLTYSADVAKGGSIDDAIKGYQAFAKYRFQQMAKLKTVKNDKPEQGVVFPYGFSVREPSAFGRKRVEFTVRFVLAATLREILTKSGMWTLTPGQGDWERWVASLEDSTFSPRGWAQLKFDRTEDRIIDLCDNGPRLEKNPRVPDERELRGNRLFDPFPPVTEQNSWILFENVIALEQESGIVSTRTLPRSPLTGETDRTGTLVANLPGVFAGVAAGVGAAIGGGIRPGFNPLPGLTPGRLEPTYTPAGGNTATRTARPRQFVLMTGKAMRVKFKIPEPVLEVVNGVRVLPANRLDRGEGFKQKAAWNNGRDVVYKAQWKLRYAIDGDLPDLPLPPAPNPLLDQKTGQ